MDKKLKIPLKIVLSGYIVFLVSYLMWYFHLFNEKQFTNDALLLIVANIFFITALFMFSFILIFNIKLLQKVWTSLSIVSITTLLIFFLIPSANNLIYDMAYYNKSNLTQDKTIKNTEKIETKQKSMKVIESRLNNSLAINDVANRPIMELQAKLESERNENDRPKKKLNGIVRKPNPLGKKHNTKGDMIIQAKSNEGFNGKKIDSEVENAHLALKTEEIIFKVQILSSSSRHAKDSAEFKKLTNVSEYIDGGLYKYTVGDQKDLKSASALQSELRKKGFYGAFVVSFKNGKRIPVRDARKLLN